MAEPHASPDTPSDPSDRLRADSDPFPERGRPPAAEHAIAGDPLDRGAPSVGTLVPMAPVRYRDRDVERKLVVTHVVEPGEDLLTIVRRYLGPHVQPGDIALIGQKLASVSQGRCVPLAEVHVRPIARLLSRTVRRTPHGLGLRRPETMEMAMREVGVARILAASVYGAMDRVRGTKGAFYRVAGSRVWAIDGPGPETIPPYDRYVVLAPEDPDGLARRVARCLGVPACIVDVNDLSAAILGASPGLDRDLVVHALRDNPMGQGRARTPLGFLRPGPTKPRAA